MPTAPMLSNAPGRFRWRASRRAPAEPTHYDLAHAHNYLATLFQEQGKYDEAIAHYRRAVAVDPRHAAALSNLGNVLLACGDVSGALDHYNRAVEIAPATPEFHFHRSEIKTFSAGDPDLAALEELVRDPNADPDKRHFTDFALAKAMEDCGEHRAAFAHLVRGNSRKRRLIHYDERNVVRGFRETAARFNESFVAGLSGKGDPSPLPVFVVGLPRSGTTLIEQILASHPKIQGAGELPGLERAAAGAPIGSDAEALRSIAKNYLDSLPALAPGRTRMIDKLPANFQALGLIHLILPNAKIIHCVRDPVDTCASCYSRLFASGQYFTYDLAELGRYYRQYAALMAHWRAVLPPGAMLEVSYEQVVNDLEGQARRMLAYCGLPWDDRCLNFHRTVRPVRTASAVQVRRPLFRSSVGRGRKYAEYLLPLLEELGDLVRGPATSAAAG